MWSTYRCTCTCRIWTSADLESTTAPVPSGFELGYARVSTTKQSLERQLDALNALGIPDERLFVDKKTGATTSRRCSPTPGPAT